MCYYRFIDDIFGILIDSLETLKGCVEYLNSKEDTLNFTLEYSMEEIAFVDVKVKKDNNNNICTDLFRKDTRCTKLSTL